jgi:hypothetical protein
MSCSIRTIVLLIAVACVGACASPDPTKPGSNAEDDLATASVPRILVAGSSLVMPSNISVRVPAGTVVRSPNNSVVRLNGALNVLLTGAGAIVSVPVSATGYPNNVVSTMSAAGGKVAGASVAIKSGGTGTASVIALAGSPSSTKTQVDGPGNAARLWGGGHLAAARDNDIVFSDRGALREITPAGVVTTINTVAGHKWNGVAVGPDGNIFGVANTGRAGNFGASLLEVTTKGELRVLIPEWTTSAKSSVGEGGLVVDSKGNLFLADGINNRIVEFFRNGGRSIFAGDGARGDGDSIGSSTDFTLNMLSELAIDDRDALYVTSGRTIRKITPDGVVTTFASNLPIVSGAIAVDRSGNVYFAGDGCVERVSRTGAVDSYPFTETPDVITSLVFGQRGDLFIATRGVGAQIFKMTF